MASTTFSASQIQALRDLPVDEVRKALLKVQTLRRATRPVKNGVDVAVYEGGLTFQASLEKLARLFPDAVHTGQRTGIGSFADVMQDAMKIARQRGKTFPALSSQGMRTAKDLVAWWKALQLRSIDINPGIPTKIKEKCETRTFTDGRGRTMTGVYVNTNFKNADLYETLRAIPMLLAISAQGETETAPVGIFCTPHWPPSHVGIVMDDIFNDDFMRENPDLLKKYPPSAVIATSDRFPQVFWILKKKYPEDEFYDAFVVHLNTHFHGDTKIRKMGWNTRIGGFMNQKHYMQDGSGKTPFVHVKESTSRYPIEMEGYMDQFHEQWLREQAETAVSLESVAVPTPSTQAGPEREKGAPQAPAPAKPVREKPATPASSQNPLPQNLIRGTITFDEMVSRLREVPVPDWVMELGLKFRDYFGAQVDRKEITRSQADFRMCILLDECGAFPDEIYSFMLKHALQDDEPVQRKHSDGSEFVAVRVSGEKAFDRKCRRDTCHASLYPKDSNRAKRAQTHPEWEREIWHVYDKILPRNNHKEVVARLEAYDEAERQYMERKQAQAAAPAMAM